MSNPSDCVQSCRNSNMGVLSEKLLVRYNVVSDSKLYRLFTVKKQKRKLLATI